MDTRLSTSGGTHKKLFCPAGLPPQALADKTDSLAQYAIRKVSKLVLFLAPARDPLAFRATCFLCRLPPRLRF